MGSWGIGPWANDAAMDWIGNLQDGIAEAITATLTQTTSEDYYAYEEVIGAADLLDSLTREKQPGFPEGDPVDVGKRWGRSIRPIPLTLGYEAERRHLWSKALISLDGILGDEEWFGRWTEPEKKRAEVQTLRDSLARKVEWEGDE